MARTAAEVASGIRGNAPEKIKLLGSQMFLRLVDGHGTSKGSVYSSDTGRKLQFKEVHIRGGNLSNPPETAITELVESHKGRDDLIVETVFEILVDEDMCNAYGTLHGGCAAFLLDPCSLSPLAILGLLLGIPQPGITQSMSLTWHRPIAKGTLLHIKSTSVFFSGRVRTARCEMWADNKLCISATHSITASAVGQPKGKL